jgi:hypothetical protein
MVIVRLCLFNSASTSTVRMLPRVPVPFVNEIPEPNRSRKRTYGTSLGEEGTNQNHLRTKHVRKIPQSHNSRT